MQLHRESDIHPHVPSERAELFEAENSGATEKEYLSLLRALIAVSKPSLVLETGAWTGAGTHWLADGLYDNGFGRLISVERDTNACAAVARRLGEAGFENVDIANCDSIDYLTNYHGKPFDFAFLDSHLPTRADELRVLLERNLLRPGALVAIHDTSRVREFPQGVRDPDSVEFFRRLQAIPNFDAHHVEIIEFPLSRGLLLIRVP